MKAKCIKSLPLLECVEGKVYEFSCLGDSWWTEFDGDEFGLSGKSFKEHFEVDREIYWNEYNRGYDDAVRYAVSFLKQALPDYWSQKQTDTTNFINDFKKYMK